MRDIERDLGTQSRVIAEQTARSLQAVDVVLKHLASQLGRGALSLADADGLHEVLKEEAVGLVQTDGLAVLGPDGRLRAVSQVVPLGMLESIGATDAAFAALRDNKVTGLPIDNVRLSPGTQRHVFPIGRRIEDRDGRFAGIVAAPGRVEYFQNFYRDSYPDPSTRIALIHRKGWLLARHPPADAALGKRIDVLDTLLPQSSDATTAAVRLQSPIDGVDHFAALRAVPDYPLVVAVTRDAEVALAPWRAQALATSLRTFALAALAGGLLWASLRQLARTQAAHRSLEVSEQRYALAMTGSDEGHWLWNISAGEIYVSDRLAALFGMPGGARTMVDEDHFNTIPLHADDRERVHRNRNDHLAGRTPRLNHEFRIVLPGGDVRWLHTRAQCFRDADGRPLRLAGSAVDVTDRKRAEYALRESEERYALAMTGSNGGHWVWEPASDAVFASDKINELFGLPAGTQAGTQKAFFAGVQLHPDDRERVEAVGADLVSGRLERAEYEFRVQLPTAYGGTERWILTRAQRFEGHDGAALRIAGVSIDVTERKLAELERQRLESELRQAQKLEAIGTLAGGIAHDFNNILSAILGYGELAQKGAAEGTPLRRHIDASIAAGQRAKSLVERILAFSRSGVGERVPVHVQSVVAEALDSVQTTIPRGVRLDRHLVAGDAGVVGDSTQIHQVVLNLCANAAQAIRGEGRITVALELCRLAAPLAVATSTLPPGEYLRLSVADDGAGIPGRLLVRIFDPFFTTKEVGVGTGLGLSLVHGIVTELGGGIAVQSTEGQGSCFTVYLPTRATVAAPRAAAPA
ncbi:MAG: PAS domain-containing protein, partial [Chitinophagaceae bacterium]|nr:PAS domain-containing protein [Rubrivivax sp.]